MAIFVCKDCENEEHAPRHFRLHFGQAARCPKCGTFRIVRLKEPDRIDPMHTGLFNLLERMANGRLYHCRYCRIQFYDRRRLYTEVPLEEQAEEPQAAASEGEAKSDG